MSTTSPLPDGCCSSRAGAFNDAVSSRQAFFLVEYMIYIAVLAVVMAVAFSGFYRCLQNSRDLSRNTEDILRTLQAGEKWRADIREATAPPVFITEAGGVAWEIPKSTGTVAYIFANGAIWRKEPDRPARQLLPQVRSARMLEDRRGQVRACRWEIELATRKKVVRVRPLFTFQAVLPPRL